MTKNTRLLLAVTLVAAAAATHLLLINKKYQHKKRLAIVSDAGYETAYDIHFPPRYKRQAR